MPIPDYNGDHIAQGIAKLTGRAQDQPNIIALLTSVLQQIQDLEDGIHEVLNKRNLDDAVGVQLTILGKLVGQPRLLSDDDLFRSFVATRILINLSEGTASNIITVVERIFFGNETFKYREEPPAQFRILIPERILTLPSNLVHLIIDQTDLGGVRAMLQYSPGVGGAPPFDRLVFTSVNHPSVIEGRFDSVNHPGSVAEPGVMDRVIGG